jgi:hypothetical protein
MLLPQALLLAITHRSVHKCRTGVHLVSASADTRPGWQILGLCLFGWALHTVAGRQGNRFEVQRPPSAEVRSARSVAAAASGSLVHIGLCNRSTHFPGVEGPGQQPDEPLEACVAAQRTAPSSRAHMPVGVYV